MIVSSKANDGRTVSMTASQAKAIQTLNATRKGGCASVKGYKPTSNYVEAPTQNIQLIAHFSTTKLYERRIAALKAVDFTIDVFNNLVKQPKLAVLTALEAITAFNDRKATMIASMEKTIDGDRSDSLRAAHDLCYAIIDDVKVHLVTEGNPKAPVLDTDGNVQVASIMVPYLELNVTTIAEGIRKPVPNSGVPVLMGNLITKAMNRKSLGFKTLSLKADNFDSLNIDHQTLIPADVADLTG